jgi:hypothetical protein
MLFVLVMECFSALVTTVEARGIFLPLGMSVIKHHISLYADDVVVFVSPVKTNLLLIKAILDLFLQGHGPGSEFCEEPGVPHPL